MTSTAQINRLRALLRDAHNDTDRQLARAALTDAALTRLARRRLSGDASREHAIRHAEIRRLALAIHDARHALKDNRAQLQSIVDDLAPGLTQRPGIGPVTAAQAIVAFSHPGRCRNDAAFASLAGTCPIPASSGRTVRHRLNRGGDRALNRAIHTIATVRMRDCPATQAYIGRRTAEGKPSARSNAASSDAIARDTRCAAARTEGVRLGLEPISEADLAPVDRLMTMLGAGLHLRCSCAGGAGRRTSRDTGPWRRLGDCLSWCA